MSFLKGTPRFEGLEKLLDGPTATVEIDDLENLFLRIDPLPQSPWNPETVRLASPPGVQLSARVYAYGVRHPDGRQQIH